VRVVRAADGADAGVQRRRAMTLAALIALALCFIGIVTFIIGMYLVLGPIALIVGGALLLTVGAWGVDVTPSSPRRRMGRRQ
jgi:hypothetical protein